MRETQRSGKRSGKRLNECFDTRSGKRSGRTLTLEPRGSRTGDKVYSLCLEDPNRAERHHPFLHGPTKQAVGERVLVKH